MKKLTALILLAFCCFRSQAFTLINSSYHTIPCTITASETGSYGVWTNGHWVSYPTNWTTSVSVQLITTYSLGFPNMDTVNSYSVSVQFDGFPANFGFGAPDGTGSMSAVSTNGMEVLIISESGGATNQSLTWTWAPGGTAPGVISVLSYFDLAPIIGATMIDSPKCYSCENLPVPHQMAGYMFQSLSASLNVSDSPIAYSPPVGPEIAFAVNYNQKEDLQPTNWTWSNLGDLWNLSYISRIQDDPTQPGADVRVFPMGGGSELYTGFNTNTGAYQLAPYSQATLVRTSTNSYELHYNNGTRLIYDMAAGTSPRSVFLTKIVDATSNQVVCIYETLTNGALRLRQVVDAAQQTNALGYALANDPLKITDITDPFGHTAIFSYIQTNGNLKLAAITDPGLIQSQFQYGPSSFINALTTPYGTTRFSFSDLGTSRTLLATDPMGGTECIQYRVYGVPFASGNFPSGMLIDTNHTDRYNTYYWTKKAWAIGSNDLSQAQITHWAVQNGQIAAIPLSRKNPLEGPIWYNYPGQTDPWGNGIALASPSLIGRVLDDGTSQIVSAAYDQFGNATNTVDSAGRITSFAYAANGVDLLTVAQGPDLLASFNYNSAHLPTTVISDCVTNTMAYAANGLLLHATNGLNQVTHFYYNSVGYLTNVVGPDPRATFSLSYDSAGHVYSLTDSDGYSITNLYDSLNRLTNTTFPDGTSVQSVYTAVKQTAQRGRDKRWSYSNYNANKQLRDFEDPAGRLFHYDYCTCGALSAFSDPLDQVTTWNRDVQGRPFGKIYADASAENTVYEATTSRVKQTIDAAGKTVNLAYGIDDQPRQVSYSEPRTSAVSLAYDTNYSRLVKMVDGIGTNLYTYVPAGQPSAGSLQSIDGPLPNDTITYGYDALGRPSTVQVAGVNSAVQYDTLGRIWWSSNLLGVTTIQYVGATERPALVARPDSLFTAFSYTPVSDGSRLQSMVTTNASGQTIERDDYCYDVRNLITRRTNFVSGITTTWLYDYDLAQELIAATQITNRVLAHRYAYTYDAAGNRRSEQIDSAVSTETPNTLNQLLSQTGGGSVRIEGFINETGSVSIAGVPARMVSPTNFIGAYNVVSSNMTIPITATDLSGNLSSTNINRTFTANGLNTTLTYDKAGNLVSKSSPGQSMSFGWNGTDRCTGITNGNCTTVIAYDGLSRWTRITEFSNGLVTADRRMIWNGLTLAEERDATGTNVVKRFFDNGFWQSGTNYYYIKDHLGSILAVTLANGTIVARFEYDPYGRRIQTAGTLDVDFGFAGLFELSDNCELAVWRIYDPATGRWNSRDPIAEHGGWNLYAYCASNPQNAIDLSGLDQILVIYTNVKYTESHSYLITQANEIFGAPAGHAALAIKDTETGSLTTYGLWPADVEGERLNNVMVNYSSDSPATRAYQYYYAIKLTDEQYKKFMEITKNTPKWTLSHNCAAYASDTFFDVTGIRLSALNEIGLKTPNVLGVSIVHQRNQ